MTKKTNRFVATLIGIALLAGGLFGGAYFIKTKPKAQRRRSMSSMIPVVETMPLPVSDQSLIVECLGTVIADKSADVRAEVSGRVIAVRPSLVEGELVKEGDLLLEIEDADYRLALQKAEANLLPAQSNFRIEEGQQDVVRQELELMGAEESDEYSDLILRAPQLKSAEAAVKSAELAVDSAKLDLGRTKIRAPYDAVVVSSDTDVGDYAQPGGTLMELAATDRYFIRTSVALSALESLPALGDTPYAAEVTLSDGSTRQAQTHKLLPDLSEKGRMARILLYVDNPFEVAGRPLLLNEYVRVRITGETVEGASLISREYLRDGNVVWMVDASRKLHILPVEFLQGYADEVLIRVEGAAGMELVTTDLSAAVDGMQLRGVGEPVASKPMMKDGPREPGKKEGSDDQ